MINPLKQLYFNYCNENPDNPLIKTSLDKLLNIKELSTLTDIFIEGIEAEKEETFYAGFNTAVKLLLGSSTI